jgi:hypothetical protein
MVMRRDAVASSEQTLKHAATDAPLDFSLFRNLKRVIHLNAKVT